MPAHPGRICPRAMTPGSPLSTSPPQATSPTLARNAALSLIGQILPLGAAIWAVPSLTGSLGTARFGMLGLAWLIIGYFSLFDLGLGRTLTQMVASRLGTHHEAEIERLVPTGIGLMAAVGAVAGVVLAGSSAWIVDSALHVDARLAPEARSSIVLLAVSLPIVITTAGLRGILEAHQRFGTVAALRVPMGLFMFLAPLAVLPLSHRLDAIIAVLLAGRVVAWWAHLAFCRRLVRTRIVSGRFERALVGPLLRFGGWISVSNLVGPFLTSVDRLIVGTVLSVGTVAYYAAPYEVITKLWLVPTAVAAVLFPAFAAAQATTPERVEPLFVGGLKLIGLLLFPITAVVVAFAHQGLAAWLGTTYASRGATVLQLLAVGVFISSFAQIPFALVQATGRPDLPAKLHLAEAIPYVLLLLAATGQYGLVGTATVWLCRICVDTAMLLVLAQRRTQGHSSGGLPIAFTGLAVIALGALPGGPGFRWGYAFTVVLLLPLLVYRRVLSESDRVLFRRLLPSARD